MLVSLPPKAMNAEGDANHADSDASSMGQQGKLVTGASMLSRGFLLPTKIPGQATLLACGAK